MGSFMKTFSEDAEPLWTVRDVARALSVSKQWVYKHAELGTIPTVRLSGGALRFRPSTIRRFIDEQERSPLPGDKTPPFAAR